MKIQKFTSKGVKGEEISLPKDITAKINLPLLAQAIYVYEDRMHVGLRKTKTRSEVERTSKKLYKQKGTGGARHGSRRAPIFVGGGVALGPRPVKRVLSLSKTLKDKAKIMAFNLKAEEKEMVFVSGISKISKTKEAGGLLKALTKATSANRFTFVLSENAKEAVRAFKNLKNAAYIFYKNANTLDVYRGGMIVMDEEIFTVSKENKDNKIIKTAKTRKAVEKITKK